LSIEELLPMDAQKLKVRELADRGRCVLNADGTWTVFSLSSTNKYKVVLNGRNPETLAMTLHTCTCPSYELVQAHCKHILACLTVKHQDAYDRKHENLPRERVPIGEPIKHKRQTYQQPNWNKYNAGQMAERDHLQQLLADLCRTVPEPPPAKTGRKPIPLATMIFSAVYKVYTMLSARRGTCDLEECHRRGHIDRAPHFNSVLNALDSEATTPILYELIRVSALPLAAIETTFAVDSSGFCTNTYTRWMDVKYGCAKQEAKWVKLHASVGTKTNIIAAALILDKDAADSPQLPPLTNETAKGFTVKEMTSDKAYTSQENFAAVDAVGGQLYSAFKVNATGAVGGLFEKAYLMFRLNKADYLKHYHQRSNSESTFSALKRKLGESVKSKSDIAQRNEVLAKVLAYNLTVLVAAFYELGIAAEFTTADDDCTKTEEPAQILRFPGA
jgi:Transposase DDE domain/SWIM zinc finger